MMTRGTIILTDLTDIKIMVSKLMFLYNSLKWCYISDVDGFHFKDH
jgi:hypothetical protein